MTTIRAIREHNERSVGEIKENEPIDCAPGLITYCELICPYSPGGRPALLLLWPRYPGCSVLDGHRTQRTEKRQYRSHSSLFHGRLLCLYPSGSNSNLFTDLNLKEELCRICVFTMLHFLTLKPQYEGITVFIVHIRRCVDWLSS